jgi:uncharacterized membrane protein YsdA (DUF1294 family)/cold shock CspA family protein
MRSRGTIIKWDEAKGFCFIAPEKGGADVFLHRQSISGGETQPKVGAAVSFELGWDNQKRPRAANATVSGDSLPSLGALKLPRGKTTARPRARSGAISPVTVLGTLAFPGLVLTSACHSAQRGWIPQWVAIAYLFVSLFTLLAYALDKYRAKNARWRISESTLHLLDAAGGWPGGFAAQRLFRHKTSKLSFQVTYWLIVLAHLAFWSWFVSDRLGLLKA